MLCVQLSIIKVVFKNLCVVKARFCPLDVPFLWFWKLTCFLTTCLSATSFLILIFSAFLYISKTVRQNSFYTLSHNLHDVYTPFAVHYEKIPNHLRETATNSAQIHSLARKYNHLRINQIQLRSLHLKQHSITLLGIHMCHWAYKREKYTFINANNKVINTSWKSIGTSDIH